MTRYAMKRTMAAALCAVMIHGCLPFGALAEGPTVVRRATASGAVSSVTKGDGGAVSGGSGTVELIKPVEPVEPVEQVKPVESVELIKPEKTAEPVKTTEPVRTAAPSSEGEVKQFAVIAETADGAIRATISGASKREIEVSLLDSEGSALTTVYMIGSGAVHFGTRPAGRYTVSAKYVTPVQQPDGSFREIGASDSVTLGAVPTATPAPVKVDIKVKVETGKDYAAVTVTQASDEQLYVALGNLPVRMAYRGETVTFTGLKAGSYDLEIGYVTPVQGVSDYRSTITIADPSALGAIKITGVAAGTNKLVVSGTATPGAQLMLTTTPAAYASVYAMAGWDGKFSAEIACADGQYTAVTARYIADSSISASKGGSWIVVPGSLRPSLSVDTVDDRSTTVTARTTAGTRVSLKIGSYSQQAVADKNGLVVFTLPKAYAAGTALSLTVYYGVSQSFTETMYVAASGYQTLERGDRGALVYTLQHRLKDLGYYTIKVDSIFGSGTERAVRLFQQVNGLKVTGRADSATQALLYSSAAKPVDYYDDDEYETLERSDRYKSAVVPLQRRLKALGYYTGSVDGYFGSGTYRAVRNFQKRNGITVTGKADPYTQTVLYSSYAKKADGSESSSGYRLLYWGCTGDSVKRLQNALIKAGYKSIVRSADGIYGKWTYDAVRAFQRDHGLSVDGIAGKKTQNKLYGTNY